MLSSYRGHCRLSRYTRVLVIKYRNSQKTASESVNLSSENDQNQIHLEENGSYYGI